MDKCPDCRSRVERLHCGADSGLFERVASDGEDLFVATRDVAAGVYVLEPMPWGVYRRHTCPSGKRRKKAVETSGGAE